MAFLIYSIMLYLGGNYVQSTNNSSLSSDPGIGNGWLFSQSYPGSNTNSSPSTNATTNNATAITSASAYSSIKTVPRTTIDSSACSRLVAWTA